MDIIIMITFQYFRNQSTRTWYMEIVRNQVVQTTNSLYFVHKTSRVSCVINEFCVENMILETMKIMSP